MLFRSRSTDLGTFTTYLRVSRGLAEGSIRLYVRHVSLYLEDRPADLARWLEQVSTSPSTFTQACSGLKAWAKCNRDKKLLGDLEDIDRPKKPRGLPKPITDLPAKLAHLPELARLASLFILETGLRVSEAYAVRVELPVPSQIIVRGKGSKDRIVLLTNAAREYLSALDGRMPWSKRWFQRELQNVGTHPHALRHTFACDLAKSGADLGEVQELLGHASPATTRVYMAYQTDRLLAAQERRAAFIAAQATPLALVAQG